MRLGETFCCGILSVLLSSAVFAEESLPTISDVKRRIQQTQSLIQNLEVHETCVRRQRDFDGGDEIYEMERACHWILSADGQCRFVASGETLRFKPVGADTVPFKVELAYDGVSARWVDYFSKDLTRPFSGQISDHPTRYTMLPTKLTVLWGRETLLEILEKRTFEVVATEVVNERNAVVLAGAPIERDGWFWNRRIHFDMEWGTPLKSAFVMKKKLADEWIEYAVWTSLEHEEVIAGVWLPHKYRQYSFNVKNDGFPKEFSDGYVGTFTAWKVNQELTASTFQMKFPENLPVNDQRGDANGRLLGQEEIAALNASVSTPPD